ncbi:unnamed protein product [Schistosoma mattheei]|uniref:Uncharacterized protein n=1 Tax=Schistosoma mattheei TaxID=31246 RepID=A0A183PJT5_9TREM|nr:unnamed protein product [Schistosoma mattheei]
MLPPNVYTNLHVSAKAVTLVEQIKEATSDSKQTGEAIGLQVSPIVTNLFIHSLETRAISKYPLPPTIWLMYVDDTFVIIKRDGLDELFINVNSLSDKIKFIKDLEPAEHRLPFLDRWVERECEISKLRVRTGSSQQSDSDQEFDNQNLKKIVTEPSDNETEMNLFVSTLMMNNYPRDFIKRLIKKEDREDKKRDKHKGWVNTVVVPYRKGISKEIRRILTLPNIRLFFRTNHTLRSEMPILRTRRKHDFNHALNSTME